MYQRPGDPSSNPLLSLTICARIVAHEATSVEGVVPDMPIMSDD
jgi:hypothetical protein